ncbi:hypothetical protein ABZZ17_36760 [Streptomyces sp. NPDC006512]|uniref:hypothetical protein n=1 Tax=Streptomyces sp. NPDC006512 TaxID=3154307 RepID=UPI0033A537B8
MTSSPSANARPGNGFGALGGVLLVAGVSGLLHEWFGFVRFLGFLRHVIPDGHEVLGYALMTCAGCGLLAAAVVARARGRG